MGKVQIITDSDSSLSPELAAKYRIKLIPITICFGDETFATNLDIDDKLLFQKINSINKLPTTDAPTTNAYAAAYNEALVAGAREILCICVGSNVSKTYESAILAAREFPGHRIKVIDSQYMSIGQGFLAIAASELLSRGATLDEAAQLVDSMIQNLYSFASLTTLKYLAMSGRVGKIVAGISSVLDIRPLLSMKKGTLQMIDRVRSHDAAMASLVSYIVNAAKNKTIERAGIFHINNLTDAKVLEMTLKTKLPMPEETIIVEFTPGLSVHAGDGLVGATLYAK
jgi:DegV family protein with EDD domain